MQHSIMATSKCHDAHVMVQTRNDFNIQHLPSTKIQTANGLKFNLIAQDN